MIKDKLIQIVREAFSSNEMDAVDAITDELRCDKCGYWVSPVDETPWGTCLNISGSAGRSYYCDGELTTAPGFFCAEWEEKK